MIYPKIPADHQKRADLLSEYSDAVDAVRAAMDALPKPTIETYPDKPDEAFKEYADMDFKLTIIWDRLTKIRNYIAQS